MKERPAGLLKEDSDPPRMPRALPSARFVQDLDRDIRRAARQRMEEAGILPGVPFEEMVIELRKLIRLLRKTLVPIRPYPEFRQALGEELQARTLIKTTVQRQQREQRRLLVVGGMVGSFLSVLGVLAARRLWRRNGHRPRQVRAEKPVGAI